MYDQDNSAMLVSMDPSNDTILSVYSGSPCSEPLMLSNGSFVIQDCTDECASCMNVLDPSLNILATWSFGDSITFLWISNDSSVLFVGYQESWQAWVTATSLPTGTLLWKTVVPDGWAIAPGQQYGAISEDGSRLYVVIYQNYKGNDMSNATAFSVDTGKLLWSRVLDKDPANGCACWACVTGKAPVVGCGDGSDGGTVVFPCNAGPTFALNGSDGSIKWSQFPKFHPSLQYWSYPLVICDAHSSPNDLLVISASFEGPEYLNRLFVYDLATGEQLKTDNNHRYELLGAVADKAGNVFMVSTKDETDVYAPMNFNVMDPVTSTFVFSTPVYPSLAAAGRPAITPEGHYVTWLGNSDTTYGLAVLEVRPASRM
eukprot:TRINITY_DN569_c0_g1_i14.p1 TRINITY_DN569_c0_g1~~TRINITY_DN569_c0_g1_i14.p1  ORF type:complete len:372 (-),score=-58.50 TRINITY_DN569_c0_g1_i14:67-1182(-)